MAPWLINVVVKAFGWSLLLRGNGLVNQLLRELGVIDQPLQLMFNETGIVIGLVHGHFMFVLLPLWAAVSGIDEHLRWAAANLGARPWRVFFHVVLPLTLPALVAGAVINFTMNMAAFATPAILGGSRTRVISYVAYEVNLVDLNWPLGAAMALSLLVITLALVWLGQWLARSAQPAAFRQSAP
jgi:ABC-type spermidine/putrescine transport system permease subunit I